MYYVLHIFSADYVRPAHGHGLPRSRAVHLPVEPWRLCRVGGVRSHLSHQVSILIAAEDWLRSQHVVARGDSMCSLSLRHTVPRPIPPHLPHPAPRLLEKRFNFTCPNISPWRRAVAGDLTSAFDFDGAPDYSWPVLVSTVHWGWLKRRVSRQGGDWRAPVAGGGSLLFVMHLMNSRCATVSETILLMRDCE